MMHIIRFLVDWGQGGNVWNTEVQHFKSQAEEYHLNTPWPEVWALKIMQQIIPSDHFVAFNFYEIFHWKHSEWNITIFLQPLRKMPWTPAANQLPKKKNTPFLSRFWRFCLQVCFPSSLGSQQRRGVCSRRVCGRVRGHARPSLGTGFCDEWERDGKDIIRYKLKKIVNILIYYVNVCSFE